ncbi:hypothetical protein EJ08DRAFT_654490 [Tothia fuscella]|uniref:SET domain-containing protein n=1 Tax=Tothia fuscella TaxID=1048955 RepID=A0A9P4NEV5_9PEZI|nr:hypothetical protein EJ08DRAFT_654490 [Tothia fuscella]
MSKIKSKPGRTPRLWPPDILYLSKPVISTYITTQDLELLNTSSSNTPSIRQTTGPCARVKIAPIHNSNHPAKGQNGLFATLHLEAGTFLLFYLGFVHGKADTDPNSDYDLSLDRELGIGIDATKMGNEGRFINDYRGITSTGPNCEFKEVWVEIGKGLTEKRMAIYVLPTGKSGKRAQGIEKGEEILVSYGKGFWNERNSDRNHNKTEVLRGTTTSSP